ncbi:MAG: MBL fold metallo-hydrolase [Proteobacteria bacterium]|nr:MBL fold metallo-hydrolase [Pseudomonadota bacterium]
MNLSLSFLGGAGTVTGSKFLLDDGEHRILIDCGLFQGYKALRLKNWAPLPVDPASIGAVLLTHAHIDHSGYIPLLINRGYRGRIFCTLATQDLCGILLPDAGHLAERDADFANRKGFSKHKPALPLYTEADAQRALDYLQPVPFETTQKIPGGAMARFRRAGHILGAASIEIEWHGRRIVFSGDLGRYDDPIMADPAAVDNADYLLVESTYGDRRHETTDPEQALGAIVNRTVARSGTVIIPSFAVGRAQSLLFHIAYMKLAGIIRKDLPVFLDSPMAIKASGILSRHPRGHRLTPEQSEILAQAAYYVETGDESRELTANPMPKIIISASGMATGGRVLHHLEHYAPDAHNAIVFAGFQAGGTRGAAMVEGTDMIKIYGHYVPVRAEVSNLPMLSAHADRGELMRWLKAFKKPPTTTFIIHGEPSAADTFRHDIEQDLGWNVIVPDHGQKIVLA